MKTYKSEPVITDDAIKQAQKWLDDNPEIVKKHSCKNPVNTELAAKVAGLVFGTKKHD